MPGSDCSFDGGSPAPEPPRRLAGGASAYRVPLRPRLRPRTYVLRNDALRAVAFSLSVGRVAPPPSPVSPPFRSAVELLGFGLAVLPPFVRCLRWGRAPASEIRWRGTLQRGRSGDALCATPATPQTPHWRALIPSPVPSLARHASLLLGLNGGLGFRSKSGVRSGLRPQRAYLSAGAYRSPMHFRSLLRGVIRACRHTPSSVGLLSFRTAVRLKCLAAPCFRPCGRAPTCAVSSGALPRRAPSMARGCPASPPRLPRSLWSRPATAVGASGDRCPASRGLFICWRLGVFTGLRGLRPCVRRVLRPLRPRVTRPQPRFNSQGSRPA